MKWCYVCGKTYEPIGRDTIHLRGAEVHMSAFDFEMALASIGRDVSEARKTMPALRDAKSPDDIVVIA